MFIPSGTGVVTLQLEPFGGGSASGQKDVNLPSIANQFGGVRFWMGFQHTGTFFVDEILVTKRNP